jgi:hypothetical protein
MYSMPLRGSTRPKVEMIVRLDRRHAVRYHHGHLGDAIPVRQETNCRIGHHDDRVAQVGSGADRTPHRGRRLGRHRMQGSYDRLPQSFEERVQVILIHAVGPGPVEPEFVLHVDNTDA